MKHLKFIFTIICIFWVHTATAQNYDVLKSEAAYPNAFVQGFEWRDSLFYSSSGGYGKSFVALYDRSNTLKKYWAAPSTVFLEGLSVWNDAIYVLTWTSGQVYVLDKDTLMVTQRYKIAGQGWGLSHDSQHFILSDGSDTLTFMDHNFKAVKKIQVQDQGRRITRINELEYAKDAIWANVWKSRLIYKISPISGTVIQSWDMSEIINELGPLGPESVLNGIAYDKEVDAFWITGKLWPRRYLVRFKDSKFKDSKP